jgi:intron-binding protein aquarius
MVDVILSLVRTKVFGYLRDIRRWVVGLSRARLGLYVLGRRSLFESCPEIQQTWTKLIVNGDQLQLVSGEMYPTQRKVLNQLPRSHSDINDRSMRRWSIVRLRG